MSRFAQVERFQAATTSLYFILTMILYPDVMRKTRKEIDTVVGHDRAPAFSDILPYVQALVEEVIRWRPVAPLGQFTTKRGHTL